MRQQGGATGARPAGLPPPMIPGNSELLTISCAMQASCGGPGALGRCVRLQHRIGMSPCMRWPLYQRSQRGSTTHSTGAPMRQPVLSPTLCSHLAHTSPCPALWCRKLSSRWCATPAALSGGRSGPRAPRLWSRSGAGRPTNQVRAAAPNAGLLRCAVHLHHGPGAAGSPTGGWLTHPAPGMPRSCWGQGCWCCAAAAAHPAEHHFWHRPAAPQPALRRLGGAGAGHARLLACQLLTAAVCPLNFISTAGDWAELELDTRAPPGANLSFGVFIWLSHLKSYEARVCALVLPCPPARPPALGCSKAAPRRRGHAAGTPLLCSTARPQ